MRKWRFVGLMVMVSAAAIASSAAASAPTAAANPTAAGAGQRALPARAQGTFVQRKTLADVGVTITSEGRFRFEKGRFFEWRTLKPMPSVFVATPTNYTFEVNGKRTTRRLRNDVNQIAKIFEIREVKDFVRKVSATPETGFPEKLAVEFRNGDELRIELKREE